MAERAEKSPKARFSPAGGCVIGFLLGLIALPVLVISCLSLGDKAPYLAPGLAPAASPGPRAAPPCVESRAVTVARSRDGKSLLVASVGAEVRVFGLDDPTSPRLLGSLAFSAPALDLATSGTLLAAALGGRGWLGVGDISDPAHPRRLSEAPTPGAGYAVAFYRGGALIADGRAGLQVFTLNDPTSPRLVGSYVRPEHASAPEDLGAMLDDSAGVTSVAGVGDMAYIADRNLRAIDLRDPAHPREVGGYDTLRWAKSVARSENLVYALFIFSGPMAFEAVAPERLEPRGVFMTNTFHPRMAAAGRMVYVGDDTSAGTSPMQWKEIETNFSVLDWSDASHPREAGRAMISGPPLAMTVGGGFVYVAAGQDGLIIVDVRNPAAPKEARKLPLR